MQGSDGNTRSMSLPPLETSSGLPGNAENVSRLDSKETPGNVIDRRRSEHRRSASVQRPTVSTVKPSTSIRQPTVSVDKFNNVFPDQSNFRPSVGFKHFLTDLISEIDKNWHFVPKSVNMDSKTSSFYDRLGLLKRRRQKKKANSTESPKAFMKQEKNEEEESKESVINKSPFFDENKERRCSRFLSDQPCSSQCENLHRYPKDDGVRCKYYYLHMECPIGCKYLHNRKCSKKTRKRYQDKHTSKRCLLYLYKDCKDISCQKLHRLPKEDNIYCLNQLSFECSKGFDCIYKHREDLYQTVTVPSNNAIQSLQRSPSVENVNLDDFITFDEDFENPSHSNNCVGKAICDTDSDNCASEYYIPDSDLHIYSLKLGGVGHLVNVLRSSRGPHFSENKKIKFSNRENAYGNKSLTGACGDTVRYEVSSTSSKRHVEDLGTARLSHGDKNSVNVKREKNLFDLDSLGIFSCESTKKEAISKYPDDESKITSRREEISSEESPDIQLINIKKEILVYDLSSDDEEQEPCRQKPRLNENLVSNVKREIEEESTLP